MDDLQIHDGKFQIAVANFMGQFIFLLPSDKCIQSLKYFHLSSYSLISNKPLSDVLTVFIDGPKAAVGGAVTWKQE